MNAQHSPPDLRISALVVLAGISAAWALFRDAHRHAFCSALMGRALIGSPRLKAARSSAISSADW